MSSTHKITAGIIGGAGYTAGELLRILVHHPSVEITYVKSDSQTGKPVSTIHKDLMGDLDLHFTNELAETDVVFLCSGHGASKAFLETQTLPGNPKIIDLSHDYRLKSGDHDFVYGLPEAYRGEIKAATKVANPGCFATSIQLGLLPLAANRAIKDEVNVTAITGSTGAGQAPSDTGHFSYRNNNLSVYKPFTHQHMGEINQTLEHLQESQTPSVNFIPVRGNFTRGIFASLHLRSDLSKEAVVDMYRTYYADHPFTVVSDENPSLKQVVGTNKGMVYVDKIDGKILIISMIDNLIKGASGQAIQNMNLLFGQPEAEGLKLKSIAF